MTSEYDGSGSKPRGKGIVIMNDDDDLGEFIGEMKAGKFTSTVGYQPQVAKWPLSQDKEESFKNLINHPPHYNTGSIEVIDALEAWDLGFHAGNVVKYVARAKHKGNELEDLKKAKWHLERLINNLEGKVK